ncbi:MAG: hypothetical protein GTO41_23715 [Burkholderiales bacterium]|nr:hypothetical protein [Burkholderiales bacterium]
MNRASISLAGFAALGLTVPTPAVAHCPLCTVAAGAAAFGAAKLGMGPISIGIFLGAFAVALGLWFARFLKKRYLPKQRALLAILSFATTILPLRVALAEYTYVYLPFWGEYGRTVLINLFLVGATIGGVLMLLSPELSRRLSRARGGKMYPFQGMAITLLLLASSASILEKLV